MAGLGKSRRVILPGGAWALCLPLGLATHALAADAPKPADDVVTVVDKAANDQNVFKFDYGVPASPALTLLGVDKSKVTQSNSLKPFVLALPTLASGSQSGQAAALDIAPAAYLIPKAQQTYADYAGTRKDGDQPATSGHALLYRTRTALALYNGVGDSDAAKQKASKASVGFSTSFLNSSDPLLAKFPGAAAGADSAWITCFDSIKSQIEANIPAATQAPGYTEMRALGEQIRALKSDLETATGVSDAGKAALQGKIDELTQKYAALKAAVEKAQGDAQTKGRADFAKSAAAKLLPTCMLVANRAATLGADLDFGAGGVWTGTPGKIEDLKSPATVAWVSYRRAFGVAGPKGHSYDAYKSWYDNLDQWFMAGLSARVGFDEQVSTGNKTTPQIQANTYSVWLGLERYTKIDRFALQVGEEKTEPKLAAAKTFGGTRARYLVTYDRRLNDNGLWVTASYGEANGTGALKDDKTAKVTFTFTSPDAPKILGGP